MPLKTNKCCCCGPCELSGQGVCCACIPRRICLYPEGCSCDGAATTLAWDEDLKRYAGNLVCGDGTAIDVVITFDNTNGYCELVFESTCAGLVGDYVLRQPVTCSALDVTFVIDSPSGCGDPYCNSLTIQVLPAPHITPACSFCDCTCRDVCVFIAEDLLSCRGPRAIVTIDEGDWSWSHTFDCVDIDGNPTGESIDIKFWLEGNYADACVIKLSSTYFGIEKTDEEYWKELGCPEINLLWQLSFSGQLWHLGLGCSWCGECDQVPCCGTSFSQVLYATVTGGDCACMDGITIPLIYDPVIGDWISPTVVPDCGTPAHDFHLILQCESGERCLFKLFFVSTGPCVNDDVTVDEDVPGDTCHCDPVELVFNVVTAGIGCCGTIVGSVNIQFTVTE